MYDTQKRVGLVKKRILEMRRRRERRAVGSLSALCMVLLVFLVGVTNAVTAQPVDAQGMYGAILLHENVGGHVLVGVAAFSAAVVITVLCIKYREMQRREKEHTAEETRRGEKSC